MRGHRKGGGLTTNLDSLVDIVSNNLGILIILAAFMALIGLIDPLALNPLDQPPAGPIPPKRLLVPWSHPTHKFPILFAVVDNRILNLDMPDFFRKLAEQPRQERPKTVTIRQKEVTIRFFPVTNQIYCLEFRPVPGSGETWSEAGKGASTWRRALARYRPEKYYYFFWVAGDSFELFREVRARLWDKQFEVGWKPVAKGRPLEICNGFEGSAGYQPQ